jgi:uncharacterized protein YbcI
MDNSQWAAGQKIAQAARAVERRRTKHGREWVAVFMNEDTIVIALHASLTAAETALAQSPAGATQVRDFHRQLFADGTASLLREIKSITGMEVRDATAEIDPTTGSVVQVFTTDTATEEFLLPPRGSAGTQESVRSRTAVAPAAKPNKTALAVVRR